MASVRAQWVAYYAVNEMRGAWGELKVPEVDMDRYFTSCGSTFNRHEHNVSWCGIFATYILRLAGGQVGWKIGKPLAGGSNVTLITGNQGMGAGDVAYAGSNHYFIILQSPGWQSGVPLAVHGNYGGAGSNHVLFYGYHTKYPISSIVQYYRISDW